MASSKKSSRPRLEPEEAQKVRDQFLNMPLEEKRRMYDCGKNYSTLADVLTWPEYFVKKQVAPFPGLNYVTTEAPEFKANEDINSKVSIWCGDITSLEIDSIVNAANIRMVGGGGVDGAIHRAAGDELYDECVLANGCPEAQAKVTGGYKLPAKYVIHTVGPMGEKPDVLKEAYTNCLKRMRENDFKAIAFPCISTGVYGYPNRQAADVALRVVREFLEKNADNVDRVIFVLFLDQDKRIYEELMQKYFPIKKEN